PLIGYFGRQLLQPEFLLAGRDLPLHARRENRSFAALRGRCAGESAMRRELQRPALVSLLFLSSNRSPRQTTVCQAKLTNQTNSATMSLTGNSGIIVIACRSRSNLHPTANVTPSRIAGPAISSPQVQLTP